MKIDQNKLRELVSLDPRDPSPDELRREDSVFFVGGNLPERETLETLYESHYQCNASLFHLTFGGSERFPQGESLARVIKKNFNAHLMGRLPWAASAEQVERAYAAGVDIVDIPLTSFADGRSTEVETRLEALNHARSVFPRWSVTSTLTVGQEPVTSTMAGIDTLLSLGVVPLVRLCTGAAKMPAEELYATFDHLHHGWRGKKALIKPLLPLVLLSTPFVRVSGRGAMRGFIDMVDDKRLLATSDLRRILRVKQVEESYASSGL
ncbi:hypothetical protein LPW11_15945 [Geomonas sp. RF6]|uniref:hypothetical protein n=1 Tax=Geomonas sp. RF6 TaxID=2897342 RepID=UPI001E36EA1C|nr:hypothetical protein [Geomonas sp. RF6]UFS69381.1 hypothetical protein LPW11_15945 [Geomonas sp. RF6]